MEDERNYSEPLHLDVDYWVQETMTWLERGVPSTAEIVQVIREALHRGGAHYAHSVHQYPGDHVHLSRGEDTGHRVDHVHQEPEPFFAGQLDSVDDRGKGRDRPKRSRIPFKKWQVQKMERVFQDTHYPHRITRRMLSRVLKEPESRVKVWFNNRRAKYRRNQR